VVRARLHNIQNLVNIIVAIFCHDSEGSKQFGCQKLSLGCTSEVSQRHKDCSWLPCSVNCWDGVVLKWFATKENFGAVKLKNCINVSLNLSVVPGEDWANSQVFEVTLFSLSLPDFQNVSLVPCLVHEHNRLSTALLA